jgi:hypothetical protein
MLKHYVGNMVRLKKGQDYPDLEHPGDYGQARDGTWYCLSPCAHMLRGCLKGHEVTEHPNGTVTVAESIRISDGTHTYHGFLKWGVWSDA